MKKFMSEFKEFISRGDVMSMSVGIIIGGAFTAIINSLVGDIVTPLLGIIMGGVNFSGIILSVGSAELMVGNFIQAIITFLLTALVIFSMMRAFNSISRKKEAEPEAGAEAEAEAEVLEEPADVKLLTEIRDLLKDR